MLARFAFNTKVNLNIYVIFLLAKKRSYLCQLVGATETYKLLYFRIFPFFLEIHFV